MTNATIEMDVVEFVYDKFGDETPNVVVVYNGAVGLRGENSSLPGEVFIGLASDELVSGVTCSLDKLQTLDEVNDSI